VGIHDNFFDLGATSVTVMQISGLLKAKLGKELPVVSMYIHPTIAQMAQFLNEEENTTVLHTAPADNELIKKIGSKNVLNKRKKNIIKDKGGADA
jgi:aryl carrier-like protein